MAGSLLIENVMVAVFAVLSVLMLRTFMDLLPYLVDSTMRARGSIALEKSVPVSRDRNRLALLLLMPGFLLTYRFRLWDPSFLQGWPQTQRFLTVAGVFLAYLAVRVVMFFLLKPRRGVDVYWQSHRASYTFYILLMLLVLPTYGVVSLLGLDDAQIRMVFYVETALSYLWFLFRRAQFLSLSCNHLRTFLYLCGLEILPSSLWVVSGIVL